MSAIANEIKTRLTGFEIDPVNLQTLADNLPVQIAIHAEGNVANQATLQPNVMQQIRTLAQAAAIGGYGSPIYQIAKILFPTTGSSLGGIPVFVVPQAEAGGSAAKVMTITVTGPATRTGTHYVKIAGRTSVDGQVYAVNIVAGDSATVIHGKIADAVNAVLGSPMGGVGAAGQATLTAKWKGLTSEDITVTMETGSDLLGLTYAFATTTNGVGTPSATAGLATYGTRWITHVINSYGMVSTVLDALEAANGHPKSDRGPATGRWLPTVFKPFVAFTGSTSADPSASTDTRLNELTIKLSPAPNSPGLPMEAAANDCLLSAICVQNTPHLDTTGEAYPDMPVPANNNIGAMADWQNRDAIMKKGCATVDIIGGQYVIQDPVTTFHPVGESNPAFRYVRTIFIDCNIRYTYLVKEELYCKDKTIVSDKESVSASDIIKPKMWKAECAAMADQFVNSALIVDADYMIERTTVQISATNADKLQTSFEYKRSGFARQLDTTAKAGFNYGTLTSN